VLLLFGGGLSLASAISSTGLSNWIGKGVGFMGGLPIFILVGFVLLIIVFLTEMTSNTATAASFLPILASVALGLGQNPLLLVIPATMGASCAFMLPVATPPNAIIYGSGKVTIPEMSKAGLWLNILFIILLSLLTFSLFTFVFSIEISIIPNWAL
jgi:sodium-dependent dicarboxylate transporter 2/3/5